MIWRNAMRYLLAFLIIFSSINYSSAEESTNQPLKTFLVIEEIIEGVNRDALFKEVGRGETAKFILKLQNDGIAENIYFPSNPAEGNYGLVFFIKARDSAEVKRIFSKHPLVKAAYIKREPIIIEVGPFWLGREKPSAE